jgi:formylglycine-generating enzyme required for sulfatase activity/tRNA A-37 threonylcarbamoyl transferase component Bud32
MFCGKCGTENAEGITCCTNCGTDISTQTPFEGKPTADPSDPLDIEPTIFQSEIETGTFKMGILFDGRYEILSEGQKGGMGVVYKVKDTKLNQLSALKIIHPRLIDSREAVTRFRQEVSISRDLLHSNIVRVYDLQEWEGKEYFTMEWVDGVTLRDILDRRKKQNRQFTLVEAANIISQLSEALHYAHTYIVHRDISPENILIERERGIDLSEDLSKVKIKLTDFGIAKILCQSGFTMESMQMGKPYYMAPEQKTDAGKVDKRADIYAVGVALFELLTLHNTIGPEMPSEINQSLPQEIDDVYKRAIATNPEKRYSSINDFSSDVNKIAAIEKKLIEEEREKAEEAKRLEIEEHKQREEKERQQQEREEAERKEKEAREAQISERKRKKHEKGTSKGPIRRMQRYKRQYKEPNLNIIIPVGVCAVIGVGIAIMFGTGGGNKSTYVKEHSSGTSTYTKPLETRREENISRSSTVRKRKGDYVDMVLVRGGRFDMGETFGGGNDDEKPVHNVTVGDFYIGKYEVTQGEWKEIMGNNPSALKNGRNYPVENVSWNNVQEFIRTLNQRTGNRYRLPTEAEWEYAARSGGKREKYAGTSSESSVGQYAWHRGNSGRKTHPVGQKSPNGLGIYDMSGNVDEWCQDIYSKDAYGKHQRNNPIYTGSGSRRVFRGGSWGGGPGYLRASSRTGSAPGNRGSSNTGFRLARTQ